MTTPAPIHPNKQNFIEGINLIFEQWPAFTISVQMEWGGHDTVQKAIEFKEDMIDYFDRDGRNIETEDIEDILLEVMSRDFCTLLEDGSEVTVAKQIYTLFHECIRGKTELLTSLRSRSKVAPQVLPPPSDSSTETEGEEEDESTDQMII